MENNEKRAPLSELMDTTISKINEMVDSNAIVGEPITTADGVTLIPISRVSVGFGSGGTDYGKNTEKFGGGGAAGIKVEPIAFLVVKDGAARLMPVGIPAHSPLDRALEMVPGLLDRVECFINRKKEEKDIY